MKDNIEKIVTGVFLVALAIVFIAAYSAVSNIRSSIASSDWVNHTHAVILEGDAVLSSLHAGETSFRNYLITGDKRDQAAYRAGFKEMVEHLEVAKALTRNEPAQNSQFQQLELFLNKRVGFTRELSQSAEQQGLEGARKKLATDDGSDMREIQHLVKKLKEDQNALLRKRDKESYQQAEQTRWTIMTGVAINFLLFAFAGVAIRDDIAARRRAAQILKDANEQLEAKVKERTAELVQANQSLQKQNLERQWANQALAHQLHYSNLIIGGIHDLVFVISKAQLVSRINPAVVHASQKESTQIVGAPLLKILEVPGDSPPDASSRQPALSQAMKEGREIPETTGTLRRKDGQAVLVRFSMVPLRDNDKVVGGVITARIDKSGEHITV